MNATGWLFLKNASGLPSGLSLGVEDERVFM